MLIVTSDSSSWRIDLVRISPSILSSDFGDLRNEVIKVDKGGADSIHIDVMDGHFVPNLTFGPELVKSIRAATKLRFDTHLMVERADLFVEMFSSAGSDLLIIHPEAKHEIGAVIHTIDELGRMCGIAINPETPLSAVRHILPKVSFLLIMSVHPGFGGQRFIPETLKKIREARELVDREGLSVTISVDGGITLQNARDVVAAGADELVAGNSIFRSGDPLSALRALKSV